MNDLLLLSTLLDGPKHGYALKKRAGLITGQRNLHNNLVYPALKKFVRNGWVTRRSASGQRGQTREIYSLSAKGRQELIRQLEDFSEKEALGTPGFQLRVGLFHLLAPESRERILDVRDARLVARADHFLRVKQAFPLGEWAGEVVEHSLKLMQDERKWIAHLRRINARQKPSGERS
jgi:DNA-binding PadR family transcriptional regulator